MKLVSVVVPTYKRPEMLRVALDSIAQQTYENVEVVLVDDNGLCSKYDNDTKVLVDEYCNIFDRFIFVKNSINMGGGGARNEGVKVATGEYITFLDDDDQFTPNKIELQVDKIEKSDFENLGFVYCQMTLFDDVTGAKLSTTKNYYSGNAVPFEENLKGCIAGTPSILIKKSVIDHVKGFRNLKSGQDWALILDVLEAGYNVDFLPDSLVNVFVSSRERISNSPGKIESLEGELKELKDEIVVKINNKTIENKIYYYHYLQLANALKFKNKFKALAFYFKMCSYGFYFADSAKFYFGLIFGEKVSVKLRTVLSDLK